MCFGGLRGGTNTLTDTKSALTTERAPAQPARRADIQGIRAIAVLVVVAFHGNFPIPGGFVGVDIFFVISGFVITAMLLRQKQRDGRVGLIDFYVRRFRRLTPALAAMVSVTVLVAAFLMSPLGSQTITASTALGAMFIYANISIARNTGGYFDALASTNPLLHTWSLSVEEQFYLILPVLFITGWLWGARIGRPKLGVAVAVAVMAAVSFVIAMASALGTTVPLMPEALIGFYGPVGRVWEFSAGALLAVGLHKLPSASRHTALASSIAGLALLCFALFGLSEANTFPGPATIVPVAGTMLLIYGGRRAEHFVSNFLGSRPLVWLGDRSYSWYLWHWPVIVFAVLVFPAAPLAAPLAAAVSILPAMISYRFVEQRFRATEGTSRRGLLGLVAATLVIPVILAGALGLAVKEHFWSTDVAMMQETQQMHAGLASGCMSFIPITSETDSTCLWNPGATGEPIYVIGDSLVDQYSEALIGASEELGRPLYIVTAAGCAPYRIILETPGSSTPVDATDKAGCSPFIDGTLDWVENKAPGLVIMGTNDVAWWTPSNVVESRDMTGSIADLVALEDVSAAEISEKKRALVTGMTSTVERLEAAGHHVVIAKATPSYRFASPTWLPGACSVAVILSDNCQTSSSVADMDELQGQTREAIDEASTQTGAGILDLRAYFCPGGTCVTSRGDLDLYLDDIHMSVPASRDLVPWFVDFLSSHG